MNNQVLSITRPLEPAEWALLGVLSLGPGHGYDLHALVSDKLGSVWQLGLSRTYAILTRLEKAGLVSHRRVSQSDRPTKKIFSLTGTGESVFQDWLARPVDNIRDIRLEFLMKLFFAEKNGQEKVTALLTSQMENCRSRLSGLEKAKDRAVNSIDRQAIDYRMHMTQATCDWLEGLKKATPV